MSNDDLRERSATGNRTNPDKSRQPQELVEEILYNLSRDHARLLLPTIFWVVFLTLLGLAGNAVAFVVYYKRFVSSATRSFILSLSAIGFAASALCCSGEIADLCMHYTFDNPWLCRGFRTFKAVLTFFSAFLLAAVAVYRHSSVCSRKIWTSRDVKLAVGICVMLAACVSAPVAVVSGRQAVTTKFQNVSGFQCSVDEAHVSSAFVLAHNIVMAAIFVSLVVTVTVLYTGIARHIAKHRRPSSGRRRAARVSGGSPACNIALVKRRSGFHVMLSTLFPGTASNCVNDDSKTTAAGCRVQNTLPMSPLTSRSRETGLVNETSLTDPVTVGSFDDVTTSTSEPEKVVATNLMTRSEDLGLQRSQTHGSEVRVVARNLSSASSERSSPVADVSEQVSTEMESSGEILSDDGSEDESSEQGACRCLQWLCPSFCYQTFCRIFLCFLLSSRCTPASSGKRKTSSDDVKTRRTAAASRQRVSRTKLTLFILIVFCCVSYLPYLLLSSMSAVGLISVDAMSPGMRNVYELFFRSYFLSFTGGSIVYSACSIKFRKRCRLYFSERKG